MEDPYYLILNPTHSAFTKPPEIIVYVSTPGVYGTQISQSMNMFSTIPNNTDIKAYGLEKLLSASTYKVK
jgi:hypothetical protein